MRRVGVAGRPSSADATRTSSSHLYLSYLSARQVCVLPEARAQSDLVSRPVRGGSVLVSSSSSSSSSSLLPLQSEAAASVVPAAFIARGFVRRIAIVDDEKLDGLLGSVCVCLSVCLSVCASVNSLSQS